MTNVWIHPTYDTGPQLVLSNSDQTMTRVSGASSNENLPFDSDATLANGGGPTIFSVIYAGLATSDGVIIGARNPSQSVSVGNYPGTTGNNSVGMESTGTHYLNNSTSLLISGGFSAGDQLDMEIDRTGSGTIRYRKNSGSWTATQDISAMGTGTFTIWATTFNAGDAVTYVNGGGPAASNAPNMLLMGVG